MGDLPKHYEVETPVRAALSLSCGAGGGEAGGWGVVECWGGSWLLLYHFSEWGSNNTVSSNIRAMGSEIYFYFMNHHKKKRLGSQG